ncbi:hypothetical protein [Rhabdaerophilum sp. SD176]|uniref:hypothetical protein n=1 Tax=Rhabdaerophilum sp. SD176 TaxID=2983548 RepID=UPI0024DF657A|nr:hypothetical protein [Rhabdaerophilum sp. SD176]
MASNTHRLFRLLIVNGLVGALLGIAFVIGILALDVAQIRTMLAASGEWLVPMGLLTMGSVVTFASVAMGGAIMLMPRDDDGDRPGRRLPPVLPSGHLVPVRIRARRTR